MKRRRERSEVTLVCPVDVGNVCGLVHARLVEHQGLRSAPLGDTGQRRRVGLPLPDEFQGVLEVLVQASQVDGLMSHKAQGTLATAEHFLGCGGCKHTNTQGTLRSGNRVSARLKDNSGFVQSNSLGQLKIGQAKYINQSYTLKSRRE